MPNSRSSLADARETKGNVRSRSRLERIAGLIEETIADAGISKEQIAGIGIGCPGPIDWRRGIVTVAVNLGWHDVPIGDFLAKRFNCRVEVLNDVDAGVYGEYRFGPPKELTRHSAFSPAPASAGGASTTARFFAVNVSP